MAKELIEAELFKAGELVANGRTIHVNCRVLSEDNYQRLKVLFGLFEEAVAAIERIDNNEHEISGIRLSEDG